MAKNRSSTNQIVVRDTHSGRFITVHGVGALKGHLTISKGIDLAKPIASQAMKGARVKKASIQTAKG